MLFSKKKGRGKVSFFLHITNTNTNIVVILKDASFGLLRLSSFTYVHIVGSPIGAGSVGYGWIVVKILVYLDPYAFHVSQK